MTFLLKIVKEMPKQENVNSNHYCNYSSWLELESGASRNFYLISQRKRSCLDCSKASELLFPNFLSRIEMWLNLNSQAGMCFNIYLLLEMQLVWWLVMWPSPSLYQGEWRETPSSTEAERNRSVHFMSLTEDDVSLKQDHEAAHLFRQDWQI